MGSVSLEDVSLGYRRWVFPGSVFGCGYVADEMMSGPATRPIQKRWERIGVAADGPVGWMISQFGAIVNIYFETDQTC